jgi:phage tail tape-measure protein
MTVVPSVTPSPDTAAPVDTDDVSETEIFLFPVTKTALNVVTTWLYVGTSVGSAVGVLLGEAVGCGVGRAYIYKGACVGEKVGALLGDALGSGVGKSGT